MKPIIIGSIVIILFGVSIFAFYNQSKNTDISNKKVSIQNTPSPPSLETIHKMANFKIITGNITRNFSNPKYHNQSADIYLKSDNPSTIHVKKSGITWGDFFATLPMKLSTTCLITGDGERLCNGENGTLKFYLNNQETPNLLDQEIKDGDSILITFIYLN